MSRVDGTNGHARTSPPPPRRSTLPDGVEVLHASQAGWGCVGHAEIVEGWPREEVEHSDASVTAVCFRLGGTTRMEWSRGSQLWNYVASPGHFSVIPAGERNRFRCDGQMRSLICSLDAARLRPLVEQEWGGTAPRFELRPAYQKKTAEIVALGQSFATLLRTPRQGGALYAETLWTQVALQLLWNFSTLPRPVEHAVVSLSDARVRRVVDFLESSLAEEISLSDLAVVADLSPNQFLNAFKKATGKTPHRYLTERRVARACELLQNPQTTIAVIALAVGFSSQSHFTTVFGRIMGTTPASYRAEVLGLRPR